MDYNKDVSMIQMLDPGTEHETSGILEDDDDYDGKKIGDVNPHKKLESITRKQKKVLLPGQTLVVAADIKDEDDNSKSSFMQTLKERR